jgi:ABC-2 type transport system ATP-binding protein
VSVIAGLLAADGGSVSVGGHDVSRAGGSVRRMLGYVPQEVALYPQFTARENLEYFGGLYGLRGRELRERIQDVLEFVALTEYARKPVAGKFSGGMRRRLNLAAGLLHRPRLLVLDEPTVGVDAQSRNHIIDNIKRLNRENGITILYTTHYMEEAEALCDRVAIMDRGRIVACETIANLVATVPGTFFDVSLAEWRPGFADALRASAGVVSVVERGDRYQMTAASQREGLAALQSAVSKDGAVLTSLSVSAPNLEQVFLKLTGRELRDEAA